MAAEGFAEIPDAARFVIGNATLPTAVIGNAVSTHRAGGLTSADVLVSDGRIAGIFDSDAPADVPRVDLRGGMVWPCFVDAHTHIDKGHIWPRRDNPEGTFPAAIEATRADREANWSAEDVRRRMDFSLRSAYAHGTALLRTHVDSVGPQLAVSWPVFAETRQEWVDRVALQAVALFPAEDILDGPFRNELATALRSYGGVLGAVTYMAPGLERALEQIFRLAGDEGFELDFHVDENQDSTSRSLRHIADAALRHGFEGRIVVGHCCSLALQPRAEADETMARVRDAGISLVTLPMCNMYLQDRHSGRTPRWRGVTLVHEMKAKGVPVAIASDNTRDPFYAYGDLDVLEVFREAVRILQLDHPIDDWPAAVTSEAANILGRPEFGTIAPGQTADLVLFNARNWTELLSRPQSDRTVLRSGKPIDRTLPDYREIDDLMGNGR